MPGSAAVIGCDGLQALVSARPGNGVEAAHAEADRPDPIAVDFRPLTETSERGLELGDTDVVQITGQPAGEHARHAQRPVTPGEQVDAQRHILLLGKATADVSDIVVESV